MALDIRTIFFMLGLATLAAAVSLFLAQRVRLAVHGIECWAWGMACAACSGFLLAQRGALSPLLTVVAANSVLLVGLSLFWLGMRRFVGRSCSPSWIFAAPAIALPFLATRYLDDSDPAGRISFLSIIVALLLFLTASELLRHGERGRLGRRWVALLLILHGLFFCVRAILSATGTPLSDPFGSGRLAMATGLEGFLFILFFTLGLVIMTSETLQAELNRQATRDPLTDVYNRRAFHDLSAHELARVQRSGRPLALLLIDLDHFKQLNDRHGHHVGDLALKHFVARVAPCLRHQDIFARYGGEEFVVLLPDTDVTTALVVAERIRAAVAGHPLETSRGPVTITVSIGVATTLPTSPDITATVNSADAALYRAKAEGRNRAVSG